MQDNRSATALAVASSNS